MRRLQQTGFPFLTAMLTATALAAACYIIYWPSRFARIDAPLLLGVGVLGALWAAALPVLAITLLSWRKPLAPAFCALVAALVLLGQVLWRAMEPWEYHGEFPLWFVQREFLHALPVSLLAGLVFGLVQRRAGPNNSSKPTPLRGAA